MPQVWNLRRPGEIPAGAVRVDRNSPWGNPFRLGPDGDRDEVVARHRDWLLAQPDMVAAVRAELAGRDLACWCAPAACHGDTLLAVANTITQEAARGAAEAAGEPVAATVTAAGDPGDPGDAGAAEEREPSMTATALLAVLRLPGVRRELALRIVDSPLKETDRDAAFEETLARMLLVAGWRRGGIAELRKAWDDADRIVAGCGRDGVRILALHDPRFPARLRTISAPPALLCVRGSREALDAARTVAVTGAGRPGDGSVVIARRCARTAAERGHAVIIGDDRPHDRGCHTAALRGCTDGGGRAVSVLPYSLDFDGERANVRMARQIIGAGGAVVSEYPFHTEPKPATYVASTRLIAGLADRVLVVEAPRWDDALHTAWYAGARKLACVTWTRTEEDRERSAGNEWLVRHRNAVRIPDGDAFGRFLAGEELARGREPRARGDGDDDLPASRHDIYELAHDAAAAGLDGAADLLAPVAARIAAVRRWYAALSEGEAATDRAARLRLEELHEPMTLGLQSAVAVGVVRISRDESAAAVVKDVIAAVDRVIDESIAGVGGALGQRFDREAVLAEYGRAPSPAAMAPPAAPRISLPTTLPHPGWKPDFSLAAIPGDAALVHDGRAGARTAPLVAVLAAGGEPCRDPALLWNALDRVIPHLHSPDLVTVRDSDTERAVRQWCAGEHRPEGARGPAALRQISVSGDASDAPIGWRGFHPVVIALLRVPRMEAVVLTAAGAVVGDGREESYGFPAGDLSDELQAAAAGRSIGVYAACRVSAPDGAAAANVDRMDIRSPFGVTWKHRIEALAPEERMAVPAEAAARQHEAEAVRMVRSRL